jgi:hypothetical protein
VLDLAGEPVRGLALEASVTFTASSLAVNVAGREARTDEDGRFLFDGLYAGRYAVSVRPAGPSAACAAPANAWVDVSAGEETQVEFAVGPCMLVEGRVDAGGEPAGGLEVYARDARGGERSGAVRVLEDGSFRLDPVLAREHELVLVRGEEELDRATVAPAGASGVVLRVPRR